MTAPKLELRGVGKAFAAPDGRVTRAVEGVDFRVEAGEIVSVVGPSGCGKSTILNMVSGLYAPSEGVVLIDGAPVTGTRSDVGFMLQKDLLLPWRTVVANVEFALEARPISRRARRERALKELERTRLSEFAAHYPHQLSGGMRQRVALARTLAIDPDVILLDEPFSALDAQTKLLLQRNFAATIGASGVTSLLITHDLTEAVVMADRVVVLSGRPGTVIDTFEVDLPERRDPVARSMHARTSTYVRRLFDALHLADEMV